MTSLSAKDFLNCCGSTKFASEMAKVAPFSSPAQAVEASRTIWWNKVDIPGWLEAFGAHPRIGDVEVLKREVPTAEWSKGEQSEALKSANNSILQELAEWNRQYEAKFGFVFLICASGKSSSEILARLKERFASRPIDELQVAATEQQKITEIRLRKLFAERQSSDKQVGQIGGLLGLMKTDAYVMSTTPETSAHLMSTEGSLLRPPITTHVLDVSRGRPGGGIEVALDIWKGYSTNDKSGEWTNIGSSVTDSDGRSGPLMMPSNTVMAGRYKLTFNTGKYFSNLRNSAQRSDLGGSFYPLISVVFEISPSQGSEHFHVPVLLSPFSYTTYRGS